MRQAVKEAASCPALVGKGPHEIRVEFVDQNFKGVSAHAKGKGPAKQALKAWVECLKTRLPTLRSQLAAKRTIVAFRISASAR